MTTAKLAQRDVTATKTVNGAWSLSALVNGYLVSTLYMGYTKREAIRLFVLEAR